MKVSSFLSYTNGLFLALATMACSSATAKKPISVDEFIAQIDRLNGQTVTVFGYLGRCEALSCRLYRNKAESEDVDRAMDVMRTAIEKRAADVAAFPFPDHQSISVGPGSQYSFFDWRASFYAEGYVVITGQASNLCRSKNTFCFDRSSELEPISIRSASRPS